MKFFKRLSAVVTAAALALCLCVMSVSAENIEDSAVSISAGKTYSGKINGKNADNYKIKVSEKGKMKISFTSYASNTCINVYNSDFELLTADVELTSGRERSSVNIKFIENNSDTGIAKGTETFEVKSGTYYIQFKGRNSSNKGKYKFSVSVPGESSIEAAPSATIKLCMEVGDKIDLSAMSGGKEVSSAKWSSSDEKIAKVSTKGKVTALKAGSCTITWKSGSSSFTVYIEVE